MKVIRPMIAVGVIYGIGYARGLRSNAEFLVTIEDMGDRFTTWLEENTEKRKDSEALINLLTFFENKGDEEPIWSYLDDDYPHHQTFTIGDLRKLSVDYVEPEPDEYPPELQKIRESLLGLPDDTVLIANGDADEHRLTVGDLRQLFNPTIQTTTNNETPKENTTP